jgi:hypothetical protein
LVAAQLPAITPAEMPAKDTLARAAIEGTLAAHGAIP